MPDSSVAVGDLLREWRQRRRLSQLQLACEADISARHLSFLESGRAQPSRAMLIRLAEQLEIPPREQNLLLTAAGFAPLFPERSLDDPSLAAARVAAENVVYGHEPYPALAFDRDWNLLIANRAVVRLLAGVDPSLLTPPVNILRLSVHPRGLAPRIANLRAWRSHLLARLDRQIDATAAATLVALRQELLDYPVADGPTASQAAPAFALRLASDVGPLDLFTTTTVFGGPLDLTVSELTLEAFYPADDATRQRLHDLARTDDGRPR